MAPEVYVRPWANAWLSTPTFEKTRTGYYTLLFLFTTSSLFYVLLGLPHLLLPQFQYPPGTLFVQERRRGVVGVGFVVAGTGAGADRGEFGTVRVVGVLLPEGCVAVGGLGSAPFLDFGHFVVGGFSCWCYW